MEYVRDYRVERGESAASLSAKMGASGFQATHIAGAAHVISEMKSQDATVFLSFTANMMASGLRGLLTQLVEEGYVDAVITTGGSLDHDIIRSYKPYLLGSFGEDDVILHRRGVNRIGNILVPTQRYVMLERKVTALFRRMDCKGAAHSPNEFADAAGSALPEGSFLRACHDRKVPVFCPGIIDAAIGMHLLFFRQKKREFTIDPTLDLQRLADIVYDAKKTGGIILGGGISKHHTIGVNLLRGGLDYAVYLTTAQEYDGSLSGAHAREAKSWGKIREKGRTATVYGDVSVTLPLVMSAILG